MLKIFDDQLHRELDTANLPESLKNAIRGINVATTVNDACNKYDLLIDEMGSVYDEVCKILLGKMSAKELAESIKLKIDYERHGIIPDLVKDLNSGVFLKVREAMQASAPGTQTPGLDVPAPAKAPPVIAAGEERKSAYGQMGSYVPRKGGPSLAGDIQPTTTPQPAQRPTPPSPTPRPAPPRLSASPTPSRSEVLRDIENPTAIKAPPKPRVEASGNVLAIPPAPVKADVLNLKKPATPPPPNYKTDPYREPIE